MAAIVPGESEMLFDWLAVGLQYVLTWAVSERKSGGHTLLCFRKPWHLYHLLLPQMCGSPH